MPYAPGIEYRGDQALMQGFAQRNQNAQQGLIGLVDYFTKQGERKKEELQLAKAADAFFKTDSGKTLLKETGMTPEDLATRSAADRIGVFKGVQQGVTMRGLQQQLEQGLAELELRKQEAQANAAFDTAQTNASRPATLEIPNTTLPGIFPDRSVATRSVPTLEDMVQQVVQTPGAGRSRAGAALLERALMERRQVDPSTALNAEANMLNARANFQRANSPASTTQSSRPTITIDDTVNGKKVRRQLTEEQFNQWADANPDAAKQKLQTNLAELRARKASGAKMIDLDQLQGSGGLDFSPWWGGKPIDDGIKYLETKLGGSKKRVRVVGPNGETGTIEDGDTLPNGWSIK